MNKKTAFGYLLLVVAVLVLFVPLYSVLKSGFWPLALVVFLGLVLVATAETIVVSVVSRLLRYFSVDIHKLEDVDIHAITSGAGRFKECTIARRRILFGRIYYYGNVGELFCTETKDGWKLEHPGFADGVLEVSALSVTLSLSHFGYYLVRE